MPIKSIRVHKEGKEPHGENYFPNVKLEGTSA